MPLPLAEELDKRIGALTMGTGKVAARAETVPPLAVVQTAKRLCTMYNRYADKEHLTVSATNAETFQALESGAIGSEDAVRRFVQPVKIAHLKPTKVWAGRYLKTWGWCTNRTNTAGNYLQYDDPRMVQSRALHKYRVQNRNVDERLLLNWDQTWHKFVRDKMKATRKPRSAVGKRVRRKLTLAKQRAVSAALCGQIPETPRPGFFVPPKKGPKDEDFRLDPISNARRAMTCCTSVWGDGSAGPLAIHVPEGSRDEWVNE